MRRPLFAVIASVAILVGANASAAPITPTFDSFGDLSAATSIPVNFGGSGIPTNPAAITTIDGNNGDVIVMGLIATPRFANATPTDDGNGTYFAKAGANNGTPGSSGDRAKWNFSFFVGIEGSFGNTIGDYGFELLYDLDPGANTDETALGRLDFENPALGVSGFSVVQGSQNATFDFLKGIPPIPGVTAPLFTGFDPNAVGEYTFAIRSRELAGQVAINVNVQAVPVPAAGILLVSGFASLLLFRRKRA